MSVSHISAAVEIKINFFVGEAIIPAEKCYYYYYYYCYYYLVLVFLFYKKKVACVTVLNPGGYLQ
jgi:hypothetical protein